MEDIKPMTMHWPSDRIGRESMKKRKSETCVWIQDEKYKGAYLPGCANGWKLHIVTDVCGCGKKVEVKK